MAILSYTLVMKCCAIGDLYLTQKIILAPNEIEMKNVLLEKTHTMRVSPFTVDYTLS